MEISSFRAGTKRKGFMLCLRQSYGLRPFNKLSNAAIDFFVDNAFFPIEKSTFDTTITGIMHLTG